MILFVQGVKEFGASAMEVLKIRFGFCSMVNTAAVVYFWTAFLFAKWFEVVTCEDRTEIGYPGNASMLLPKASHPM